MEEFARNATSGVDEDLDDATRSRLEELGYL
jgi:hypothetical protein